jgi:hypothetical protein
MSKTTSYADLGKAPADLAGKGYPAASTFKVNHEATIPCGAVFKNSFSTTSAGKVNFTVEPEYKWNFDKVPVAFKGKWTSDNECEASLAVSDLAVNGTEVKPWFKRANDDKTKKSVSSGGLQLGFVNNQFNVSVKTETPADLSKHKVDASVVLQFPDNLFWGVNAQYTHSQAKEEKEPKVSPWLLQGRLHYAQPASSSSLTLSYEVDPKDKADVKVPQYQITWFQKVNSDLQVATSFVIPPGKQPSATVASEHKWDASTSVKSKVVVGAKNRVAVAYTQQVTPYAVATVGADLNANKLVGSSNGDQSDHSFGFELKLK